MNSVTGTLHHHQACVDRNDPVAMLKRRVAGLFVMVATWHERAHQRRQLLELDERLLEDAGIRRDDALVAGRKPFWLD